MAAAFPYSRALSKQLLATSARSFTRPATTSSLLRVSCDCTANDEQPKLRYDYLTLSALLRQARTYATASTTSTRKPRAASTRTSTTKKTATTKKTTTKKPAKKTAAKKPKKVAKKPKKKAVKKPKPKVKRPPTKAALLQKERASRANLRATALLDRPKQLPSTAYQVLLVAESKSGENNVKAFSTSAAAKYKNLSPEEREQLNHEANNNKAKNDQAYKNWVQKHTPLEIKKANNARRLLTAQAKAAGKKTQYNLIHDDRSVKRSRNPFSFFYSDRHASGDFKGLSISEAGKLAAKEWADLSASSKKPYLDQAAADHNRYLEEHKSVYGIEVPSKKTKKA